MKVKKNKKRLKKQIVKSNLKKHTKQIKEQHQKTFL